MLSLCCCIWAFSSWDAHGLLTLAVCKILGAATSLAVAHKLQACGLQELKLLGSRVQAPQLWHTSLVVLQSAGSSQVRHIYLPLPLLVKVSRNQ